MNDIAMNSTIRVGSPGARIFNSLTLVTLSSEMRSAHVTNLIIPS